MEDGDIGKGTLLHYAAGAGLVACVTALIDAGAKVNAIGETRDNFWQRPCEETPLDVAEKAGICIIKDSETGLLSKRGELHLFLL
jgi:hypothetical protein